MKYSKYGAVFVFLFGLVFILLALVWPGTTHHKSKPKVGLIPPITMTDTLGNKYPLAPNDTGVCQAVGIPYRDILAPSGVKFEDIAKNMGTLKGAQYQSAASLFLLVSRFPNSINGVYGPAIVWVEAKYVAQKENLPRPEGGPDPKVVKSAQALDRFLALGSCP